MKAVDVGVAYHCAVPVATVVNVAVFPEHTPEPDATGATGAEQILILSKSA